MNSFKFIVARHRSTQAAAVAAMSRSLAKELARRNIRVNCVAPGYVPTDAMVAAVPAELDRTGAYPWPVIEALKAELHKIRTGRAHPGILDQVHVEYYGSMVPISQVANITVKDSRTLQVVAFERNMLAAVDKAIQSAGLNLNPTNLGELLLISMPALTEETRKGFTKQARSAAEDARVAVRNIRRDALGDLKKLVKDKEISEDEERRALTTIAVRVVRVHVDGNGGVTDARARHHGNVLLAAELERDRRRRELGVRERRQHGARLFPQRERPRRAGRRRGIQRAASSLLR